jgi:hypothetical protein
MMSEMGRSDRVRGRWLGFVAVGAGTGSIITGGSSIESDAAAAFFITPPNQLLSPFCCYCCCWTSERSGGDVVLVWVAFVPFRFEEHPKHVISLFLGGTFFIIFHFNSMLTIISAGTYTTLKTSIPSPKPLTVTSAEPPSLSPHRHLAPSRR